MLKSKTKKKNIVDIKWIIIVTICAFCMSVIFSSGMEIVTNKLSLILGAVLIVCVIIIGVLFAITALIPYIGAFITLVVGSILIGVTNPMGAVTYIIIFFIVQQIDDNFTYPKIVGKSVGLPPLVALVAVLFGGTIFGVLGMIISIPMASIIYSLFKDYVDNKVKEKKGS